ncbi:hypothetical protein QTI24_24420 [Variovorax sp. J22P240]|nr:hypothetical protein [Variovorax sp. J22P240]
MELEVVRAGVVAWQFGNVGEEGRDPRSCVDDARQHFQASSEQNITMIVGDRERAG